MNFDDEHSLNQELINEVLEFTHFIKTPLASIKIGGHILSEAIPPLIDAYKQNIGLGEQIKPTTDINKLEKLISIVNNLTIEANRISEYTKKIEKRLTDQKDYPKECDE